MHTAHNYNNHQILVEHVVHYFFILLQDPTGGMQAPTSPTITYIIHPRPLQVCSLTQVCDWGTIIASPVLGMLACSFRGDPEKFWQSDFSGLFERFTLFTFWNIFEVTPQLSVEETKHETELLSRPMDVSCLSIGRTHSTSHRYHEERCWAEKGAKSTENMSGHHLSTDKVNNNCFLQAGWGRISPLLH